MNTCLLCSLKENCDRDSFALYPLTPIVKDILVRVLWGAQLAHRLDHSLILLSDAISEEQLACALKAGLTEIEMRDIRITQSRNAEMMNASSVHDWLKKTDTSWFDKALREDRFTSHFQPIVDYGKGQIHGHECLIRLYMDRPYNGGEIMHAAMSRGRIHIFDSYTRQLSVRLAGNQHPEGTKVFINFMPSSIYDPAFCMKSTLDAMRGTHLRPEDIVFEVVESEAITDVKHLRKICDYYRTNGFGFALDDVGTGANSLQMVCDLKPHYMKIDKSLISGLDQPMYRSMVEKMVGLGREFGVQPIAEGIETEASAEGCSSLGISLMQGYYFAKPAAQMVATADSLINLSRYVGSRTQSVESMEKAPAITDRNAL
jgi:EAL domain-containing protein (putative c-di-GMP-specific phosphodiesterase class I)